MNLDIFKILDPSGKMYKEAYVSKNHINEYSYIINFCIENSLDTLPFKQKVYHAVNDIKNIIKCKNINCDNTVNYRNSTIGYYEYCSNKCVSSDPYIINIKQEKSLDKFGTKTPGESDIVKNKTIETNIERYGGRSPMCDKNIMIKSKETLMKNWGVDNPNKSQVLVDRRIESFKKSNYKESFKKTSIEKYGVEHPWMNKEVHQKSVKSGIKIKNIALKDKVLSRLFNKKDNLLSIDYNNRVIRILCERGHEYEINRELLYWRNKYETIFCTICNPINKGVSGLEIDLYNFIKDNYDGDIIRNDRKVLCGKEIDILLPEINLAFEFNGLWWHSDNNKPEYYHINKINKAKESGINLVYIWEDDWKYKNNIIKSIILNRIGNIKNRLYARNCIIKDVSTKDSVHFLEENHIQGNVGSKVKLGLYHNNELISIMTFGSLRLSMGHKNIQNNWELIRFCSKLNTIVVGGANKLFKFFIDNYEPQRIISYSEISKFDGSLYSKLGFISDSISKPNYFWVLENVRYHRYNYRKDILVKRGYDKDKTEYEIMTQDIGAYKVFDCGQKRWIWKIDK